VEELPAEPIQSGRAREHVCSIIRAASAAFSATRQSIFHSQRSQIRAIHKSCDRRRLRIRSQQ